MRRRHVGSSEVAVRLIPLPIAFLCLLFNTMEHRYLIAAVFSLLAALLVYWPGGKRGEGETACPLVGV